MKRSAFSSIHLKAALAAIALLLLGAWTAVAGEKQFGICYYYPLAFDRGQWEELPSGNIQISGLTFTFRVMSEDPLWEGKLTVVMNYRCDAQLNGAGQGQGLFEGGTWTQDNSGQWVFAANGDLWLTRCEAVGNLVGEHSLHGITHGIAGSVDGMLGYSEEVPGLKDVYVGWILDPKAK